MRFATWPLFPDWLPERLRDGYAWFLNVAGHDVNLARFYFPDDLAVLDAHCPSDGSVVATLQAGTVPIALEIAKTAAGRWLEGAEFLFERGRIAIDDHRFVKVDDDDVVVCIHAHAAHLARDPLVGQGPGPRRINGEPGLRQERRR